MWMSFNKANNIKPEIFIDCRSLFNNNNVAPTYKLAMKENIINGQIFAIDNIFFALYFLKGLKEFENGSALVYGLNNIYYVFDQINENCFHITDIVVSKHYPNHINYDWISNSFEDFEKSLNLNTISGKGSIIFNNIGYIVINLG
jgi:hypothetical protein